MNKVLIVSADSALSTSTNQPYDGLYNALSNLVDKGDKIIFTSAQSSKLQTLRQHFKFGNFGLRKDVDAFIKKNKSSYFIVLGAGELDFYLAVNNKVLFFFPEWAENQNDKARRYGLNVSTVSVFTKIVDIIKNQSSWYYSLKVDDITQVFSLTSANTRGAHSAKEVDLVDGFRSLLKEGKRKYMNVLLYHFLASITNNEAFRDINDWAIFPSSSTQLNREMLVFKERARYLMKGMKKDPLFLRDKVVPKSHHMRTGRIPCDRHFQSIVLNPVYKNKLKGRSICILDDYLTNGTSFETVRNLLVNQGVKKIICVSLGKFGRQYLKQDYKITGDVYASPDYTFKLISQEPLEGTFTATSVTEIENLYDIIYR